MALLFLLLRHGASFSGARFLIKWIYTSSCSYTTAPPVGTPALFNWHNGSFYSGVMAPQSVAAVIPKAALQLLLEHWRHASSCGATAAPEVALWFFHVVRPEVALQPFLKRCHGSSYFGSRAPPTKSRDSYLARICCA
jgi:hypothetical protein